MKRIISGELKYLGKKIQIRRKELGLTQEQLSEKLGCSLTHLSRIETGYKPSLDALWQICQVLDFSMDKLFGLYPADNHTLQKLESLLLTRSNDELDFLYRCLQILFDLWDQHKKEKVELPN